MTNGYNLPRISRQEYKYDHYRETYTNIRHYEEYENAMCCANVIIGIFVLLLVLTLVWLVFILGLKLANLAESLDFVILHSSVFCVLYALFVVIRK